MYTKEQLLNAKEILLNLISNDRELRHDDNGICHNASSHILNTTDLYFYSFIPEFSVGWKYHSGAEQYPIPYVEGNKWEGPNLELRIDLMKHIVSKIDEMLEQL